MNRIKRLSGKSFCTLMVAALLGGCAGNEELRLPPSPKTATEISNKEDAIKADLGPEHYASIEKYSIKNENRKSKYNADQTFNHTTAYIEFDEQGDFLDRRQLLAALDTKLPVYQAKNRLLIFYAHGWQNNTRSRDVALFNQFVAHLNRALSTASDQKTGERWSVYGVYLSWRGTNFQPVDYVTPELSRNGAVMDVDDIKPESTPGIISSVAWIKYFTFWSRKAAANRFAGAPLMETIQSISNRVRTYDNDGKDVLTRTVLIGHSFGAYIIEKTLLQSMASEEPPSLGTQGQGYITPPADLVVLLNSAAPAIYAKEFIDFMKWHRVGENLDGSFQSRPVVPNTNRDWKRPFVVSITSEADVATKLAFPAGTLPEGLFDVGSYEGSHTPSYEGANQKAFFTHTPGHCNYIVSHDLIPSKAIPDNPPFTSEPGEWLLQYNLYPHNPELYPGNPPLTGSYSMKPNEVILWGDNGYGKPDKDNKPGKPANPQVWALRLTNPNGYNKTPYWIIRVPKQIIADHGDVWNPNTASLVAGIYRMAGLVPFREEDRKLTTLDINPIQEPANGHLTACPDYPLHEPDLVKLFY